MNERTGIGATAAIARFVSTLRSEDFPREAVERAKMIVADSFACILSGAGSEVAPTMLAYIDEAPGGAVPILGTTRRATPQLAALVNGTFAAALDYDDLMTPVHPSAVVVTALCSELGGGTVSGKRFLEAYIVGIEVGAKIASAIGRGHSGRGFHATATLCGFSSFAAIAYLKALSATQIEHGLGIVATNSGGLLCSLGTMAKPFHSGLAARLAVDAEALTRLGFTASPVALEAERGFFAAYGDENSDANLIEASLGRPWAVIDPGATLKRFPSCIAGHRAMAAVLDLKKLGATAGNVENIEVAVAPGALQPLMYPKPETGLQSKFSMQYAVAAALVDDRVGIVTFETDATQREAVKDVMSRIHAWEDPQQAVEDPVSANLSWGYRGYARVTATLKDGRVLRQRIDVPPGHPSNPLDWSDLGDKMRDCAASVGLPPEKAALAFEALRELDTLPDVNAVIDHLVKVE
ncbi:MmgE/PrpD family protein [Ensifer sp. YR511]|uniref:MmgE/PrpD family protein n=1 Tax=Ensifer sp. YR511 TaxID=1855294 RepID=UPI00088B1F3D|nr:MmgE/PrpD family protein [Ensifer sp. YR511]SDN41256.1 2-methylcitrate dehydratase PrpD [Ensifer sp. YR511]